jgi:hypothetical protein
MAQARLELLFTAKNMASGAVNSLNHDLGKFGLAAGAGAAIGTKALGLLDRAMSGVVDLAGQMVEGALADEESQNRLRASLKTNVPAWDGTTDAIERRILAGQKLGFEDEGLRDSLTVLVGSTHDVGKAFEVMGIAQDLARFKGIDLKTASEALIKVEGGVYRSLKGLGIVLRDGATQQEALAAVQKVTAGQAEAYANTNRGKLLASQIKVNEAMERLGSAIVPSLVDALSTLVDTGLQVVDVLGNIADGVGDVAHQVPVLSQAVDIWDNFWKTTWLNTSNDPLGLHRAMTDAARDFDTTAEMAGVLRDAARGAARGLDDAATASHDLAPQLKDVKDAAQKAADALAELIFGPGVARAHRAGIKLELKDAKEHLADLEKVKHPTRAVREDIAQTKEKIGGLNEDLVTTDAKLAAIGDKPAADELHAWLLNQRSQVQLLGQDAVDAYNQLARLAGVPGLPAAPSSSFTGPRGGMAEGGYAAPGTIWNVGERGRETMVALPNGGAYVIPNRGGSSSSAPVTLNVVVDGQVLARIVDRNLHYGVGLAATTGLRT